MQPIHQRLMAALALAGALGAAGLLLLPGVHARANPAGALQTTNPTVRPPPLPEIVWVRKPTRRVLEDAYPERALRRELNGWAILSCTVRADGNLEGCKVMGEEPRDIGFGVQALSLQSRYQVDLSTAQGQALAGQTVQFVVNFNVLR